MTFRVVMTEAAAVQAARAAEWWRQNRADSPDRFEVELETVVAELESEPLPAQLHRARPPVYRVLTKVTRAHVYFTVDLGNRVVTVLAIWGGPRRRAPRLPRR